MSITLKDPSIDSLSELLSSVQKSGFVEEAHVLVDENNPVGVSFERELEMLLNRFSAENKSNTPDFVLASYLKSSLAVWDLHTKERDRWWGNRSVLGVGNGYPRANTSEDSLLKG